MISADIFYWNPKNLPGDTYQFYICFKLDFGRKPPIYSYSIFVSSCNVRKNFLPLN